MKSTTLNDVLKITTKTLVMIYIITWIYIGIPLVRNNDLPVIVHIVFSMVLLAAFYWMLFDSKLKVNSIHEK